MVTTEFISGLLILTFVLFYISSQYNLQQVSADGLTQENLPPVSLGDREAGLFIKINPPIYTAETKEDAYMQFRLFDANTNETLSHVTYNITIGKDAIPTEGEKPLVSDLFHTHEGTLTLKVEPTNGSLSIFGNRDLPHDAYIADPEGTINLKGPVLQEGGLYRIDVQILGVDNDQNVFAPEKAPRYGTYLSMGDTFNFRDLDYGGQTFNTTLISYYDRIDNFIFNSTSGEFSWSMPFDYNTQRLEENLILVHEEIKLPKSLFGSSTFNATVNGQPISGRSLAIDPFTSPSAMVLHYLVDKDNIITIANQWLQRSQGTTSSTIEDNSSASVTQTDNFDGERLGEKRGNEVIEAVPTSMAIKNNTGTDDLISTMDFTLRTNQPSPIVTGASLGSNGTSDRSSQSAPIDSSGIISTDLLSDTGGIQASILWSPSPIKIGIESSANIKFTDMFTGGSLNADVMYNLSVLDNSNTEVVKNEGLIAKNSQDMQSLLFPASGEYQVILSINGLQTPSGQQEDDSSPIDRTRNGVARGSVLVAK
jgi:hypothetical protein